MRVRHVALAALTTLLLAACGGGTSATSTSATPAGNHESSKTGQQVANDAADALEKAGAAHLTGTGTSDGKPMTVDLRLQDADAAGTITMDGGTLDITTTAGRF